MRVSGNLTDLSLIPKNKNDYNAGFNRAINNVVKLYTFLL